MAKSMIWKLVAIGMLAILLLIPLSMVEGLVRERQAYRQQAIKSIADGTAGGQLVSGPVWVLPYRQQFVEVANEKTGEKRTVWRDFELHALPDKLSVAGRLRTEPLTRGIYETRRYTADLTLTGQFELPDPKAHEEGGIYEWGQPYLSVGIADVRGIKASPTIAWGTHTASFAPGAQLKALNTGIHANLPSVTSDARHIPFKFQLTLEGMDDFHLLPVGRDTEVSLQSDWQHPGFDGRFLPENRSIGKDGFIARWRTSWFSTNLNEHFEQCANGGECANLQSARLGVRLVEPVDVYLQSDRAVKYGFLFVFLTFCTFLLTEVLKRVAIHPVQYGLVGVSLAIFFLLLLSFAEQWAFMPAYLVAATACVLQNAFYASHVLGNRLRGAGFAGLLATLYGLLYVLLSSEDRALLLGSLLLFGLLTVVMVLTRKLDWYGISQTNKEQTI